MAQGLAEAIGPAKMNYEIHGNTIPHLHMHLLSRAYPAIPMSATRSTIEPT